jgi:hypothetical protein
MMEAFFRIGDRWQRVEVLGRRVDEAGRRVATIKYWLDGSHVYDVFEDLLRGTNRGTGQFDPRELAEEVVPVAKWDEFTLEAMAIWGGGFVQHLSRLYRLADAENRRRIEATWPEYGSRYTQIGERLRQDREVGPGHLSGETP